jgi:DnaJ-class molecular chaperone
MSMAKCRRCNGSGRYSDQNPTVPGQYNWCAGCGGDGSINVPDATALCRRCNGSGRYSDQNPTVPGTYNWCAGCAGSGYAR